MKLKVSVLLLFPLRVAGLVAQAEASSNGSQGQNLVQGVMQQASQGHLRFKKWCGTALNLQVGRCSALEKILVQTDLSRAMPLQQALAEAAAAGAAVEHARVVAQAAQSSQKQQLVATKGSAEDAARDVKVLQNAAAKLGHKSAEAHIIQSLLVGVIAEEKHSREKVAMFQVQKSAESEQQKEIVRLEQVHRSKQENVNRLMSQKVAGDQSMQVLTTALRDEAAYLSDLQTTCKLGREVYKRMAEGPLQDLNRSLATLSGMHGMNASPTATHATSQQQKQRQQQQPQQQRQQQQQQPKPKPEPVVVSAMPRPKPPAGTPLAAAADAKADVVRSIPAPNRPERAKKRLQRTKVAAKARPVSHSSHAKHVQKTSHAKHTAQAKQALKKTKHARKVTATSSSHAQHTAHPKHTLKTTKHASKVQPPPATDYDLGDSAADTMSSQAQHTAQTKQTQKMTKHALKVQPLPAADDDLGDSTDNTAPSQAQHTAQAKQTLKTKLAPKAQPLPAADDDLGDSAADTPPSHAQHSAQAKQTQKMSKHAPNVQPLPAADDDLGDSTDDTAPSQVHSTAQSKQTLKMTKHAPRVQPLPAVDDDLGDSTADTSNAAVPAQANAADTGDDATEAPPQPIALRKRRVHKANTKRVAQTADQGAEKDSDADLTAELDADTASASRPLPKLGSRSSVNNDEPLETTSVDSGDDDSSTETPVKLPPKVKHHRHSARPSPPAVAVVTDDGDATSEAGVASAASPSLPTAAASTQSDDGPVAVEQHAPKERSRGSLVQEGHNGKKKQKVKGYQNAQNPNLPQQYTAFDPNDVPATQTTPQEASFEQMVADFKKDDDDDSPAANPVQSKRNHVKKSASAPAASKDDDDESNYNDDDLPKHHKRSVVDELSGGWKAFIKAPKPKKTVEDGDIQMMNSLYSSDGSLPKAYSTWTPEDGSAAPTSSSSDDATESTGGSDDVRAAAKELESSAAVKAAANELEGADSLLQVRKRRVRGAALGATSVRISAAAVMLDQYAKTLQSVSLKKLASSKLSATRLVDALKQLQAAPAPKAGKQQAQAEQWCRYFQANAQSATPVRSAIAQAERAAAELAEAIAARSAGKQEEAAQAQLQRTVEQDVQGIIGVLNNTEQEAAYFKVHPVSDNLGALAVEAGRAGLGQELLSLEGAVQGFQYAHVELLDLLQTMLEKRNVVLHTHNARLAKLSGGDKLRDQAVKWKRAAATQSQAGVEAARHRIQGIQAACDATLAAHGSKRHSPQHRAEAHAAKMLLQLLQGH